MSTIFNSRLIVEDMADPRLQELVIVKREMRTWKESLKHLYPDAWKSKHISWQLDFDVRVTINGSLGLIEFLLGAWSPLTPIPRSRCETCIDWYCAQKETGDS